MKQKNFARHRVSNGKSTIKGIFILHRFFREIEWKQFQLNAKNTLFCALFAQIWVTRIFYKNQTISRVIIYSPLISYKKSEKTNEPILRKTLTVRQMDRWMNRQTYGQWKKEQISWRTKEKTKEQMNKQRKNKQRHKWMNGQRDGRTHRWPN